MGEMIGILNLIIAVIAVGTAVGTVVFTKMLWDASNRPIIVVEIEAHAGRDVSIQYNIAVENTGTRPARNIKLKMTASELDRIFAENLIESERKKFKRVFDEEAEILILPNGRRVINSFGYTGHPDSSTNIWKYNAVGQVTVTYYDFDNRKFSETMPIKIRDTAGFAGQFWDKAE